MGSRKSEKGRARANKRNESMQESERIEYRERSEGEKKREGGWEGRREGDIWENSIDISPVCVGL